MGDEPFEIRFKNNSHNKVQVKISVDGTDVLTGKPANTEIDKDMWVVNAYSTLSLKAWPETNNGGAGFVFTSANNSVSLHTHGDLSNRGIIAAAVYEESHVEPIRLTYDFTLCGDVTKGGIPSGGGNYSSYNSSDSFTSDGRIGTRSRKSLQSLSLQDICDSDRKSDDAGLEKLVAVGAGQHIEQKITYVTGLTKPRFAETVRVRYLWWDDLVSKLKESKPLDNHPSGFPGDKEHKIMSLGNTPRLETQVKKTRPVPQPSFSRF